MKQKVEELGYIVRQNIFLYVFSSFILCLITIVIGLTVIFLLQAYNKEQAVSQIYKGKNMFQIVDSLNDSESFRDFRLNADNMDRVANFYNSLVTTDYIDFLSVFTQPLFIEEQGREGLATPKNISEMNAVQMNKQAFDFYQLRVDEGTNLNWQEIHAEDQVLPVLLGSDYQSIYQIGDNMKGIYYSKDVTFKVVGFLEENSSIYFQGNSEFYLDSYILVPYPWRCSAIISGNQNDLYFKGILYFAMLYANIATDGDAGEIDSILSKISNQTGFYQYLLMGQSVFTIKYDQMLVVIKSNKWLLMIVLGLLFVFASLVQISIFQTIRKRRGSIYKQYQELGLLSAAKSDMKMILSLPYVLTFVISTLFFRYYEQEYMVLGVISTSVVLFTLYMICYQFVDRKRGLRDAIREFD